jgi:hypothetical protein
MRLGVNGGSSQRGAMDSRKEGMDGGTATFFSIANLKTVIAAQAAIYAEPDVDTQHGFPPTRE